MKSITLFLLLINLIFSKSKTEKIIEDFLYARYSGDTTTIKKMVSESFLYKNIPYVGLNLTTKNENGSLIVTGNINRSYKRGLITTVNFHVRSACGFS